MFLASISIEVFTDTVQDSGRPNKTMDNRYNRAYRVYVMIYDSRLDSMIFCVDILDLFLPIILRVRGIFKFC